MKTAPIPKFEKERLQILHELGILNTKSEKRFDGLVKEAVDRLCVPMASVSVIDSDREWYKSSRGLSKQEEKRHISFCGHALVSKVLFVIEDTLKDHRFSDNPLVTGEPFVRFYAGRALYHRKSNLPIAVFCIKDDKPRVLSQKEIKIFLNLAERAEDELNKKVI